MTFTAPDSDGGAPIIGYEISTDGGPFTAITYTGTGPYATRVGQANFCTKYGYRIRAVNSVGAGAISADYTAFSDCS